jgi:uncharacterized membrane protein
MGFAEVMDAIATGVEVLGVSTLVVGLAAALVRAGLALVGGQGGNEGYRIVRTVFGRSILLGLEFLVAADIIRTGRAAVAGERGRLGADRADQDVPELLVGGGDRWPLAVAACGRCSVRVVDPIARHERARRLVSYRAA